MSSHYFLASMVSSKKSAVDHMEHPLIWWIISLTGFNGLSSCFTFNTLFRMYIDVDLFDLTLLGPCWASWMYKLRIFIQFEKSGDIISSNTLSSSPFFFLLAFWYFNYISEAQFILFSVCQILIDLPSNSLILSFVSSNLLLNSTSKFLFQLYFSTPGMLFDPFLQIFIYILYLTQHCSLLSFSPVNIFVTADLKYV